MCEYYKSPETVELDQLGVWDHEAGKEARVQAGVLLLECSTACEPGECRVRLCECVCVCELCL